MCLLQRVEPVFIAELTLRIMTYVSLCKAYRLFLPLFLCVRSPSTVSYLYISLLLSLLMPDSLALTVFLLALFSLCLAMCLHRYISGLSVCMHVVGVSWVGGGGWEFQRLLSRLFLFSFCRYIPLQSLTHV